MDSAQEQQVLSSLYNRLYEAVTYAPQSGGNTPAFGANTILVQFTKNEALREADFANALNPANPNGNLNTAEQFSRMVDILPQVNAQFVDSGSKVSDVYQTIVNGANTNDTPSPAQQDIYNKAFNFLNVTTKVKDFTGQETTQSNPSPIYAAYQANLTAYISAVSAYRTAFLGYDLTKLSDQRAWQANEPLLSNAITQAYNTWRAQGAPQVEQALAAINTSVNSAVANALSDARTAVSPANQMASSLGISSKWLLSYALPSNWYDLSALNNFSSLTLKSSFLDKTANSSFTSYGGGGSWGGGLWSVGGSFGHQEQSSNAHMDANDFTLTAKIGLVRIFRPWLHEFIFKMQGWFTSLKGQNGISNGALAGNEGGLFPLVPTAFLVARDISISANFSTQDESHLSSSTQASTSVGWGPFSVSGSYAHSETHDTFQSTYSGGTLRIPGIQIIAWVSAITPASPPMNAPKA